MKGIKRIAFWALLSILMQCAGLLYLDKVYFKHSSTFSTKKIDTTVKDKQVNVSIPLDAEKVQVSTDGRFITYYKNNKFMLVNTTTAETKEILSDDDLLYTGWVPNNNMIMVAEKTKGDSGKTVVKLKTYNVKTGIENPIKEICTYKNGMEVTDVVTAVLSGVSYVSITRGGNSGTIYRIDVNNDISIIDNKVPIMGSMSAFLNKDVLFYEDGLNKTFYSYTNGKRSKMNFPDNNLVILRAVNDDMLYMGKLAVDGQKIESVFYGKYTDNPSTWQTVKLDKARDVKDVFINKKGEILENDNLTGIVKNHTTNEEISYQGKFIAINDKIICSSDNGNIYIKSSVSNSDK